MSDKENKDVLELEDRPFLDFYKRHKISPVSQDISDIEKHFSRRRNLYRSLGLLPTYFKNKRVIEFGPGSGHNAVYTNSLEPSQYVLVDANPSGLEPTKKILKQYSNGNNNYEVIESLIEEYRSDCKFDVVFCEGVIPYQNDSVSFLKHIATFVDDGGVLVVTSMDNVGILSETLRQIIRVLAVDANDSIEKQLEVLRPIFRPHLDTLLNMSRPIDDWILDAIIQPMPKNLMSMQEAINALNEDFDVYGSSPKIFTDWRWYKDVYGDQANHNNAAIDSISKNIHNFMDYRYTHQPQSAEVNDKVISLCDAVFNLLKELEVDKNLKLLHPLNESLNDLSQIVSKYSPETSAAIDDFIAAIEYYIQNKSFPELKAFAPFFGRGQQYLSFTRKI